MDKMSKGMNIPKVGGMTGPKYTTAAKGEDLAKGVSHYEKLSDVDGMYARPQAESNQMMPKGSDRI